MKRLKAELGVITKMGFSGYFLIVADFIKWAKIKYTRWTWQRFGAGSVAYCLGITELDPIKYDLLLNDFSIGKSFMRILMSIFAWIEGMK